MSDWELVCGLEVHAHLKTRTKMFCRCELEYGAAENTHTCPVCLAHPGALPVPNARAIELTILLGLALDCEIAERAVFARKNYFYPDLPKGYQISQYEAPLCGPGRFLLPTEDGDREIGIVRAHLEEDAAKTVHAGGATGRSVGADYSLVDFNRGGTPLLEIVSAPDLRSADEAMSLPPPAAPDDPRARRVRRRHGEGHAARGRERLGAARRGGRASGRAGRSRT